VLNILQAATILLVLIVATFLALKDETLRYKTEPESFGYQNYQNLLATAAAVAKDSPYPYARYNHQSLVSRSVLENFKQQQQLIAQHSTVEHVFLTSTLKMLTSYRGTSRVTAPPCCESVSTPSQAKTSTVPPYRSRT
jgi:hypothetical protein